MTELPRDPDRRPTSGAGQLPHQHGTPPDAQPTEAGGEDVTVRVTAWVRGHVQGVGFRWWTRSQALQLGLVGWARNLSDGRVEVLAQGAQASVRELIGRLEADPGAVGRRPGRVDGVTVRWSPPRDGVSGFVER
jgi:acylphosphatase